MAFLPDGNILITERPGCLRIVRNGVLDPKLVAGLPPISAQGLSGLMDIALHPRFAENKFVYLTYHKPNPALRVRGAPPGPGGPPCRVWRRSRAARGTATALTNVRELFSADVTTEASRIVFGRDGMIYMSLGRSTEGANAPSQDPEQLRRQAAAIARRWDRAAGQSVRWARRIQARDLHDGSSQSARSRRQPGDRRDLGERAGTERRRRGQHHSGREELRLAGDQLRPQLPGPARVGEAVAGRDGAAGRGVDPFDCALGHDLLHGRQVPRMEAQPVRRRPAPG